MDENKEVLTDEELQEKAFLTSFKKLLDQHGYVLDAYYDVDDYYYANYFSVDSKHRTINISFYMRNRYE